MKALRTATFTRPFQTVFTTAQFASVALTVYDSGEPSPFPGCEGSCSVLERVSRTAVSGQTIDARPVASRKRQVWNLALSSGPSVHLTVNP